jgi:hypothetical protein
MNNPSRHAIRLGLAALLAVTVAGSALARPDTRAMTCAQTRSLIERSGAIVLTTGSQTYDRFVGSRAMCDHPYVPTVTYVRTRDGQCPVYNCQKSVWDDFPFN